MKTDNMPSLRRVLEIIERPEPVFFDLAPRNPRTLGMDATMPGCMHICGTPQMSAGRPSCPCGKTLGHPDPCDPSGPPSEPRAGRDDDIGTHDVCPMTGGPDCPSSRAEIDKCGSC